MSGWDEPETPAYYEAFCRSHSRYTRANAELISHARIAPGLRVLDLGAGTGRTAEAALSGWARTAGWSVWNLRRQCGLRECAG